MRFITHYFLDPVDTLKNASSSDATPTLRIENREGDDFFLHFGLDDNGLGAMAAAGEIDRFLNVLTDMRRRALIAAATRPGRSHSGGLVAAAIDTPRGDQADGAISIADYDNRPEA